MERLHEWLLTASASCASYYFVSLFIHSSCHLYLVFWLEWLQRTDASQWLYLTASYTWRLLIIYLLPLASSPTGCWYLSLVTWNKNRLFSYQMVLCSLQMFSFICFFFFLRVTQEHPTSLQAAFIQILSLTLSSTSTWLSTLKFNATDVNFHNTIQI